MKVNKKSALALGALIAGSMLVLAGCAAAAAATPPRPRPKSREHPDRLGRPERVDALRDAAEAYTEETGVKVELVGKDNDHDQG